MRRSRRARVLIRLVMAGLLLAATAPVARAAPPSNDDRAGATPISVFEDAPFDLAEATVAVDDPGSCGGDAAQGSVWFAYTAIEAGPVVVTFSGVDTTAVHVLAPDGLAEIGCASTADPLHLEPQVTVDAMLGETYLIEIAGRTDVDTRGSVFIERPLAVSLAPVTSGHVTASGAAVFILTFTCSQDMVIEPEVDLSQGSGSTLAMGSTLETYDCAAPQTVISMTVRPGNGDNPTARFHAGPAEAYIQYLAFSYAQFYRSPPETNAIDLVGGPAIVPPPTDAATATEVQTDRDSASVLFLFVAAVLAGLGWLRLRRPSYRRA